MTARALVIGIGNPDRGDDAVGLLVARLLAEALPPDVAVTEAGGDALMLLERWRGADPVVLVDAAAPLSMPGTIHRLDPVAAPLPREIALGSTHAFGVAEAVELARALGRLPERMTIYAIEGASFAAGAVLTPVVAAAAREVAARITADLAIYAAFGSATAGSRRASRRRRAS
ncbi:MAG TPA: hydrogenase maturation protease [Acetobacteraceae bacterium]|nr:hydrogenase maturation protease [Acetobacteraceae bacterium]